MMSMSKHQILANVLLAPKGDIPEIVAAAINQWTSDGSGITELLFAVLAQLAGDEELRDEFHMALEDWS
jgi:predicted peptidase